MFGELINEFPPAARILVLELNARWSERISLGGRGHAQLRESPRSGLSLGGELCPLIRGGAVAATGHHQRASAIRIGEAKMQCGKSAHRKPHHMRAVDLQRINYRLDVVARAVLRVFFGIVRYLRWRIAT